MSQVVPGDTDSAYYSVYINNDPTIDTYAEPAFTGKFAYFAETVSVDVTDWIEQWIATQTGTGIMKTGCYITVRFAFYGNYQYTQIITLYSYVYWNPDVIDLHTPVQGGIICGGANGYPPSLEDTGNYPIAISVYPLYFGRLNYTIGGVQYSSDCMFDPSGSSDVLLRDGGSTYTYTTFTSADSEQTSIKNQVFTVCKPYYQETDMGWYYPVQLTFQDGDQVSSIDLVSIFDDISTTTTILPLYTDDFTDLDSAVEWKDNVLLRYNQSVFDSSYNSYVKPYIDQLESTGYTLGDQRVMTDISFEVTGYGYKVMMLYHNLEGLYPNEVETCIFTSEYVSCAGVISDCPYASIVLIDSGFVFSGNDTFQNRIVFNTESAPENNQDPETPTDVVIPLKISNGRVKGKTVNTLDKTTYMDRYGDIHNSIISNSYEIECYIDSEWLEVKSGYDINYEKLVLACQSALKTYFCSNAPISGLVTADNYMMEGRIKDIENVETYSNYSSEHKIPTYKITFEVYR